MNFGISEINTWLYGLATGLLAGVIYLLRKITTNEKQIEMLRAEISMREEYREKRDVSIDSQLSEIRDDIKSIIRKV